MSVSYKYFFRNSFLSLFLFSIALLRNLLLDSFSRTIATESMNKKFGIRSYVHDRIFPFVPRRIRSWCTKTFNGRHAAGRNRCRCASERIFCRFYSFKFIVSGRSKPLKILRGILNAFLLTVDPSIIRKSLLVNIIYISLF